MQSIVPRAVLVGLLGILLVPRFVSAAVVINEIAWMGSPPKVGETFMQAANNEWLELFNDGTAAVDLMGWRLEAADGTPVITLVGSVLGGGFFLLERTNDETVSGIPADLIYTGGLSNSGEVLTLKDPAGSAVHTVDASGGWPAGDNATKDTMQRSGAVWVTAPPTPRAANSGATASASPPPSASSGQAPPPPAAPAPAPTPSLGADAGPDVTALAGAIVEFRGTAFGLDGEALSGARFLWNFGDGTLGEGRVLRHTYYFPGTYRANLTVSSGEHAGSDWRSVIVRAPAVRLSEIQPGAGGFVELANGSSEPADLGGMGLLDIRGTLFAVPAGTIAPAAGVIVFANAVTGLDPARGLTLRDARGSTLDSALFSGDLAAGASWERASDTFSVQHSPTPGRPASARAGAKSEPAAKPAASLPVRVEVPAASPSAAAAAAPVILPEAAAREEETAAPRPQPWMFFGASIGFAAAAAFAFLWAKRETA